MTQNKRIQLCYQYHTQSNQESSFQLLFKACVPLFEAEALKVQYSYFSIDFLMAYFKSAIYDAMHFPETTYTNFVQRLKFFILKAGFALTESQERHG